MNRLSTLLPLTKLVFTAILALSVSAQTSRASAILDGCTNPFACNYSTEATEDDGSCEYLSCIGCMNEFACNFDSLAVYPDLSCEYFSCAGCTAPLACNYDDNATVPDDASCDFESCAGCTDFTACNFDIEATLSTPISCEYPLPDYDCEGNPFGCINCAPVFLSNFIPDTVDCFSDLPTGSDAGIIAIDPSSGDTLEVGSFLASVTDEYALNLGTTADGAGSDGAIRLFGLAEQLGLANSDYFVESFPLMVSRYSNGIAVITGQVSDIENPNLKWNLHLVLEDLTPGDEWLDADDSHDFLTVFGCDADTADWTTYRMNNAQSYLTGAGGYEGSWLQLSHMPYSESKRFQLGQGGNGVNCDYGLGGWFAWEGTVLGQSVLGMSGDLVINLGSDNTIDVPCGSEYVIQFYNALNPNSGDFTEEIQFTYAVDTTAPEMEATCESLVNLCFEPASGVNLPDPCSFNTDDCGGELTTSYTELVLNGDPNGGNNDPFEIERTYTASDCSGNSATFVQSLVYDGEECDESEGGLINAFHEADIDESTPTASGKEGFSSPGNHTAHRTSTIAPNPSKESSMLKIYPLGTFMTVVRVFNLAGIEVLPAVKIDADQGMAPTWVKLNGQGLVSGCYLVRTESPGQIETLRWIISK